MKKKSKSEGSPIVRGDVAFITVKEIGELNANGKKVLGIGYGGRIEAKPDMPLILVAWLLKEIRPMCRYSSKEAAAADLKFLQDQVNGLKVG